MGEETTNFFLATVAHELKTPLTVIQGFAEMLHKDPDGDHQQRVMALEAIWRRSLELSRAVERLLMSTRVEVGPLQMAPEEVLVDLLLAERAAAFAASGHTVKVDVPDRLPAAWADPGALGTVIDHLLDNAVKYSPDRGPVEVMVVQRDGWLWVEVRDRGIGMTGEQMARCFDKFWQAEQSDARRFPGSGVGLFIVRSLVEAMEGQLRVESSPGEGTTFSVGVPLTPVPAAS